MNTELLQRKLTTSPGKEIVDALVQRLCKVDPSDNRAIAAAYREAMRSSELVGDQDLVEFFAANLLIFTDRANGQVDH